MLDSQQYDKLKKIAEAYKLLAQATLRAGGQKKQSTTVHKNLKVLELGLDEYGVKQETSKRVERKIKSIKDYPVCGMWADREDMLDSARWVKEIRKKHWEYRHDTPTG